MVILHEQSKIHFELVHSNEEYFVDMVMEAYGDYATNNTSVRLADNAHPFVDDSIAWNTMDDFFEFIMEYIVYHIGYTTFRDDLEEALDEMHQDEFENHMYEYAELIQRDVITVMNFKQLAYSTTDMDYYDEDSGFMVVNNNALQEVW